MEKYDVVIIGGGPAGLFAAIMCAKPNARIAVLEKNKQCGRKLLMSGAGKCNLTQGGNIKDFFECYNDQGKFLKHALLSFDNEALLQFFQKRGLQFLTMENGKVFPKSLSAQDVLDILLLECKKRHIEVITQAHVETVEHEVGHFLIKTEKEVYESNHLIMATGGLSYPITGSTGDGQRFAKDLGHKIVPMKPALTSVKIKNYALADLSGQSFEGLTYTLWRQGKKVGTYTGDVLLTHTGLSGPGILNHSRYMQSCDVLKLNFTEEAVDAFRSRFTKRLGESGKDLVKTVVRELALTRRFADRVLTLSDISKDLRCAELKKNQRQQLLTTLTEYELEVKELGGYHMAMVTTGGVSLKEIHPKTMESRKIKGLYLVGEVTDIDGDTGGYNLQAAFSMAYMAGNAIKTK